MRRVITSSSTSSAPSCRVQVADRLHEGLSRGDKARPVGHQIENHAGQLAAVLLEHRDRGLRVVERQHHDLFEGTSGTPLDSATEAGWSESPQLWGVGAWLTSA